MNNILLNNSIFEVEYLNHDHFENPAAMREARENIERKGFIQAEVTSCCWGCYHTFIKPRGWRGKLILWLLGY